MSTGGGTTKVEGTSNDVTPSDFPLPLGPSGRTVLVEGVTNSTPIPVSLTGASIGASSAGASNVTVTTLGSAFPVVTVSVPAGNDVTEGNTTDAAVVTGTGTLSAKLRGLVQIFNDVWASTPHYIQVALSSGVTGTVTVSGAVNATITNTPNVTFTNPQLATGSNIVGAIATGTNQIGIVTATQGTSPTTAVLTNSGASIGNVTASIPAGNDVTEGNTTDAAVVTGTGTISAKLRGLVQIMDDVWASTPHALQTVLSSGVTGTVTISGAANVTVTNTPSVTFTNPQIAAGSNVIGTVTATLYDGTDGPANIIASNVAVTTPTGASLQVVRSLQELLAPLQTIVSTTAATATVVSGTGGKRIWVVGYHLVVGASTNVLWQTTATSPNNLGGTLTFVTSSGVSAYGSLDAPVFISGTPGDGIQIRQSGATTLGGSLTYYQF